MSVTGQKQMSCYEVFLTAHISLQHIQLNKSFKHSPFLPFRWMLSLLSVTSVNSMALEHCFAPRHCTLHPHPLLPRQVPQFLGTGSAMVTGKVKGWPWVPTAQPHREEKCVTWVCSDWLNNIVSPETCPHLKWTTCLFLQIDGWTFYNIYL